MRIGFSIVQTAALSVMGMQAVNGVRLWVSQVERKGDIRIGQQLWRNSFPMVTGTRPAIGVIIFLILLYEIVPHHYSSST
jgi:hypothetical protein